MPIPQISSDSWFPDTTSKVCNVCVPDNYRAVPLQPRDNIILSSGCCVLGYDKSESDKDYYVNSDTEKFAVKDCIGTMQKGKKEDPFLTGMPMQSPPGVET